MFLATCLWNGRKIYEFSPESHNTFGFTLAHLRYHCSRSVPTPFEQSFSVTPCNALFYSEINTDGMSTGRMKKCLGVQTKRIV